MRTYGPVLAAVSVVAAVPAVALGLWSAPAGAAATGFVDTHLVSDVPGRAPLTDPLLKNPWGIALGPSTPLWVANNGTAMATVYAGANGTTPVSKVPLDVWAHPGVTGQVYNPFQASRPKSFMTGNSGVQAASAFLFDGFTAGIAAWHPGAPLGTAAALHDANAGGASTGLAIGAVGGAPPLFAADVVVGAVRVYDGAFRVVGSITDPTLPHLVPYGVQVLGDRLYVTYSAEGPVSSGPSAAVDSFALDGSGRTRLVTDGPLEDPWGMALAPAGWGSFGGDLLVGNVDDGRINAFDPATGAFRGTVTTPDGKPFSAPGLWGIAFGNGVFGTARDLVYVAGTDGYAHGLLGTLTPAS